MQSPEHDLGVEAIWQQQDQLGIVVPYGLVLW